MAERLCIPFFTDHNVADSAGTALKAGGHSLTRLRDCMPRDTKDPVVALACIQGGQVLVSHDNDFRGIAERLNLKRKEAQLRLHRIQLACPEPEAAKRLTYLLSLIEHEWAVAQTNGHPMVMIIRSSTIWIPR